MSLVTHRFYNQYRSWLSFGNYIDKAIELTPRVTIATCVVAFLATLELTDTISQKRKEASKNSNIKAIHIRISAGKRRY